MNKKVFCTNCGKEIKKNWEYCKHCGLTLTPETIKKSDKENIFKIKKPIILIVIFAIIILILFFLNFTTLNEARKSVVKIIAYDVDNNELATGSGFCAFDNDKIVTNFHVIEGAYSLNIQTYDYKIYKITNVLIFNYEEDMAILEGDFELKPLKLGNTKLEKVGNSIKAIGSPEGQLSTVSNGIISNLDSDYQIRFTAPISHGSSGGALLNKLNQVIGITYATYGSDSAQNLNYAIDISYLKKMWKKYNNSQGYNLITQKNYTKYFNNDQYDYSSSFKNSTYYGVDSLSTLYNLTSERKKFSNFLLNQTDGEQLNNIYLTYALDEQLDIAMEFKNIYNQPLNILNDLTNHTIYDAIIDTEIIPKYKYLIILNEYYNSNSINSVISKIPMSEGEPIFLKAVYENNYLTNSQKDTLATFIFYNCNDKAEFTWFEYFGYEITKIENGKIQEVTY